MEVSETPYDQVEELEVPYDLDQPKFLSSDGIIDGDDFIKLFNQSITFTQINSIQTEGTEIIDETSGFGGGLILLVGIGIAAVILVTRLKPRRNKGVIR